MDPDLRDGIETANHKVYQERKPRFLLSHLRGLDTINVRNLKNLLRKVVLVRCPKSSPNDYDLISQIQLELGRMQVPDLEPAVYLTCKTQWNDVCVKMFNKLHTPDKNRSDVWKEVRPYCLGLVPLDDVDNCLTKDDLSGEYEAALRVTTSCTFGIKICGWVPQEARLQKMTKQIFAIFECLYRQERGSG